MMPDSKNSIPMEPTENKNPMPIKPPDLAIVEVKERLVSIVQQSALPITVIEMIFSEFMQQIGIQAEKTIQGERESYSKAMSEMAEKNKKQAKKN